MKSHTSTCTTSTYVPTVEPTKITWNPSRETQETSLGQSQEFLQGWRIQYHLGPNPPVVPLDVDVSNEQEVHHEGDQGHHHWGRAAVTRRHVVHEQNRDAPEANKQDELSLPRLEEGAAVNMCERWGGGGQGGKRVRIERSTLS